MGTPLHLIRTETRGLRYTPGGLSWVGLCSCGWVGSQRMTEAAAEREAEDHTIYVSKD